MTRPGLSAAERQQATERRRMLKLTVLARLRAGSATAAELLDVAAPGTKLTTLRKLLVDLCRADVVCNVRVNDQGVALYELWGHVTARMRDRAKTAPHPVHRRDHTNRSQVLG